MYIYYSLIYSRAILSFAWLTGYTTRPVVLSYTVHTDSFTAHNNNFSPTGDIQGGPALKYH